MKIETNGISINYAIDGRGPWVTLSHALACNLYMWDRQVEALRDRYSVLRFDTRGHGGTDAPPGPYTFADLAGDVCGLLDALGIERTHFVGLSMGGMIGMQSALGHPQRFASLVLCDTSGRYGPEAVSVWADRIATARAHGMEALVEPTLKRWFTDAFLATRSDVTATVADMIRETSIEGYAACGQAIARIDLLDRLHLIDCPVRVIVGELDPGAPLPMAQAIRTAIAGADMVIVRHASHLSNLEQPDAFNHALLDFLERVGQGPSH